jgi:hypothetical protein
MTLPLSTMAGESEILAGFPAACFTRRCNANPQPIYSLRKGASLCEEVCLLVFYLFASA